MPSLRSLDIIYNSYFEVFVLCSSYITFLRGCYSRVIEFWWSHTVLGITVFLSWCLGIGD